MESPKNKLISFSFNHKLDSPKFTTVKIGGQPHNPIYKATVHFLNNEIHSTGYGKKQAEFNACSNYLNLVNLEPTQLGDWFLTFQQVMQLVPSFSSIKLFTFPLDFVERSAIIGSEFTLNILFMPAQFSLPFSRRPLNTYIVRCQDEIQQAYYIAYLIGFCKGSKNNTDVYISNSVTQQFFTNIN